MNLEWINLFLKAHQLRQQHNNTKEDLIRQVNWMPISSQVTDSKSSLTKIRMWYGIQPYNIFRFLLFYFSIPPLMHLLWVWFIPNFEYSTPQKLKISYVCRQMMYTVSVVLVVLFSHHSLGFKISSLFEYLVASTLTGFKSSHKIYSCLLYLAQKQYIQSIVRAEAVSTMKATVKIGFH